MASTHEEIIETIDDGSIDDVSIDDEIPGAAERGIPTSEDDEYPSLLELLAIGVESSEGVGLADIAGGIAESLARIADGVERHNKLLFKIAKHLDK